jgi:hypothetical protein
MTLSGLRRHCRAGLPDELIQSRLRGGKQGCLDAFDGLVCTHWEGRHEAGAGTCQVFTNR